MILNETVPLMRNGKDRAGRLFTEKSGGASLMVHGVTYSSHELT